MESRIVQRRAKRNRRKLTKSISQLALSDNRAADGGNAPEPADSEERGCEGVPTELEGVVATEPLVESQTSDVAGSPSHVPAPFIPTAADECAVCFDPLGPQRILFVTCGHARLCEDCSVEVGQCPLCMAPVNVRMRIYV